MKHYAITEEEFLAVLYGAKETETDVEEPHRFSEAHEARMETFFQGLRDEKDVRPRRLGRWVAAAASFLLLLALIVPGPVQAAARAWLFRALHWTDTQVEVRVETPTDPPPGPTVLTIDAMPIAYRLTQKECDEEQCWLQFEDDADNVLIATKNMASTVFRYDVDAQSVEEIDANGTTVTVIDYGGKHGRTGILLYWIDGEALYSLYGTIELEDLLAIAAGME